MATKKPEPYRYPKAFEWLTQLAEAHRIVFPPEGSARAFFGTTYQESQVSRREKKMLDAAFQAALKAGAIDGKD